MKYFAALTAIAALAACQAEPSAEDAEAPAGETEAPAGDNAAAPEMLVYTDYLGEWAAPGDCERMTWDISEARFTRSPPSRKTRTSSMSTRRTASAKAPTNRTANIR